ncbi:MAG: hypothetical protein IJE19_04220, partial [Clostridia bacterium]|nr:hypothetical protein [Clostridia bacterium]
LDLASLDAGEINILTMIATRLLCAVSEPFYYFLEKAFIRCGDTEFTFTYRNVESYGWKTFIEEESEDSEEPEMQFDIEEGDVFEINNIDLKENFTKSKPNYTEDTLLSAMENAGAKETPEDAERKGLGTPATRAAMIEKLIATGFVQRKNNKKTVSLVPTFTGKSLITVLPEQIQSPLLMAGMGSANIIRTRKITNKFYLCGDEISDVNDGMGLVASRVMLCAAHQAHTVLRILAGKLET